MTDTPTTIVFLLFPGITQLDFTAPAQAFCRMPGATLVGAAKSLDPIATDSGFAILPTHDFAAAPQADILCIPGGHGVVDALGDPAMIDFIARQAAGATWVTSVCTGAFLLGGALAGLGGALYAHWIGFLSPEQFGLMLSFELLMMAFIGGVERLDGALWGALVFVALPPVLSALRSLLPPQLAATAGLEGVLLGVVIVALVIWRPQGLAGGRRPPAQ